MAYTFTSVLYALENTMFAYRIFSEESGSQMLSASMIMYKSRLNYLHAGKFFVLFACVFLQDLLEMHLGWEYIHHLLFQIP